MNKKYILYIYDLYGHLIIWSLKPLEKNIMRSFTPNPHLDRIKKGLRWD